MHMVVGGGGVFTQVMVMCRERSQESQVEFIFKGSGGGGGRGGGAIVKCNDHYGIDLTHKSRLRDNQRP
jgi:hypothetical protein